MTATKALDTWYRGRRYRSRLEARWAVCFDHLGVKFDYETQGYLINGRPYLPDFLLTDCGTWVEVKGEESKLDHSLMLDAAKGLPERDCKQEPGPKLLILGPIPEPPETGDLGWIGIDYVRVWRGTVDVAGRSWAYEVRRGYFKCECGHARTGEQIRRADLCEHILAFVKSPAADLSNATDEFHLDQWWGFGRYHEELRPQVLTGTSRATPVSDGSGDWLTPALDPYEEVPDTLAAAYRAALSARFEHGENGASR